MPFYDYECPGCHHVWEENRKVDRRRAVWCPVCGGRAEKKVRAPLAIQFKGKGFHATDYPK